MKQATYRFFVYKDDKPVNIDTLPDKQQEQVGIWAYQTMLKALGYQPRGKLDAAAGQ